MKILENLETDKRILYSDSYFSGIYNQKLFIKKSIDDGIHKDKFFISVWTNIDDNLIKQGHIYFYLDNEIRSSHFIGVMVNPKYRNLNIGSLLIASWIDLCLSNGYDFLMAHEKQRKPFLLYLLKTYGFDILDKSLYDTRRDIVSICRGIYPEDMRKLLLFKDFSLEKKFMATNIYTSDNYEIIHNLDGVKMLDDVIFPIQNLKKNKIKYELIDKDIAEKKTIKVLARHKR